MNPEIVSFQYATGMCLLLENVGGSEQNRSVANVLWPSRMHAATHILQEKTNSFSGSLPCELLYYSALLCYVWLNKPSSSSAAYR